jgi:Spy/CpxP family protein refolding chaperone
MRKLALSLSMLAIFGVGAFAQEGTPQPQPKAQDEKPNLLQQLGLSSDQLRQIRQLNQDRKPAMDVAQRRVREANQALDAAIYSDNVDEDNVKARLNELQQAQADIALLRFTNELAIRKVLTPDQLGRFRELRREFAEKTRQEQKQRRQERIKARQTGTAPGDSENKNLRQLMREQNQRNRQVKSTPSAQGQPKPKG